MPFHLARRVLLTGRAAQNGNAIEITLDFITKASLLYDSVRKL